MSRCLKSIIPFPLPLFFLPLPFHSTFNRTSFFASISIRRSTVYRFTIFYHLANHYNGQFHRYKHRYTHCILIYFPLRCFSSSQRDWGGKKQRQINRSLLVPLLLNEKGGKKERKKYFVVGILRSLERATLLYLGLKRNFLFLQTIQTVLHNWKQEWSCSTCDCL